MKIYLQLANTEEDTDFTDIIETEGIINDTSGVVNYDISGSGMLYARIRIEVTAGSIDVQKILYVGAQIH